MAQTFKDIIEALSEGSDLTAEEAQFALDQIVTGRVSSEETAAFLFGMRVKGETAEELTSFVRVMRDAAVKVNVDTTGAVDLCGTGGDGSGTFNISTAAMIVVAGAGIPVLKHGNRNVSSQSGSADVLEKLGVVATLSKEGVEKVYEETSMAFMFAPNFHPAMKNIMPARRALGIRTFFNILGPLLNPAGVRRQVIGAYNRETASMMAHVLQRLGTEQAFTVSAMDGLDEVSTTTKSEVFGLNGSDSKLFDPQSLGYQRADKKQLAGGDAEANAAIIRSILEGTSTRAQLEIVLVNAAFGIQVSGRTRDLDEAAQIARESVESGAALRKLNDFKDATQEVNSTILS